MNTRPRKSAQWTTTSYESFFPSCFAITGKQSLDYEMPGTGTWGLFSKHLSIPCQPAGQAARQPLSFSPLCWDAEKQAVYRPRGWRDERGKKGRGAEETEKERRRALEHIHRLTLTEEMENRAELNIQECVCAHGERKATFRGVWEPQHRGTHLRSLPCSGHNKKVTCIHL